MKELETGGSKPVPPRIAILRTNIPLVYKAIALEKMASMKNANGGELHKLTQWMSGFMSIPLGKYIDMPVNLEDHGVEKCSEFMNNAKATLDRATYGLNDAKSQIGVLNISGGELRDNILTTRGTDFIKQVDTRRCC